MYSFTVFPNNAPPKWGTYNSYHISCFVDLYMRKALRPSYVLMMIYFWKRTAEHLFGVWMVYLWSLGAGLLCSTVLYRPIKWLAYGWKVVQCRETTDPRRHSHHQRPFVSTVVVPRLWLNPPQSKWALLYISLVSFSGFQKRETTITHWHPVKCVAVVCCDLDVLIGLMLD